MASLRTRMAVLLLLLSVSSVLAATPGSEPPSASTSTAYFMRLWAEDAEGKRVFDLGSSAEVGERFNMTVGHIVGVVLPGAPAAGRAAAGAATGAAPGTVQEITLGLQWSAKLINVQADDTYRAEATWNWEPMDNRQEHFVDRRTRSQVLRVSGKVGAPTLIGLSSSPKEPLWRVYLKLEKQPVTP